ncbi:hypothetical protein JXC34_03805 [Candidatus Woesearchaeota archaeon]|nr:hypothetical protein [Candidatus Woesearchaeota archaeon]
METKPILIYFVMILIVSSFSLAANPYSGIEETINAYLQDNGVVVNEAGDKYLQVHFDDSTNSLGEGFAVYGNDKLSIELNSKVLNLDLSSFVENKEQLMELAEDTRPTEILIKATGESNLELKSPIIILSRFYNPEMPDNLDKIIQVIAIDDAVPTTIYFDASDMAEQGTNPMESHESRVLIVEHYHPDKDITDSSRESGVVEKRLAAVSNNRADLIIFNGDVGVKSTAEGTVKVAVSTLLKDEAGDLEEHREIDFTDSGDDRKGVIEIITERVSESVVKLVVDFFKTFSYDVLRDRFFKVDTERQPVEVIYDSGATWSEELPDSGFSDEIQAEDCDAEGLCILEYENQGDTNIECFCTLLNGIYAYRNEDNELCDIPKNPEVEGCVQDNLCAPYTCDSDETDPDCDYELSDEDWSFSCCDGTKDCETDETASDGTCSKIGFMVLPIYGDQYTNIMTVKRFSGQGGTVLLLALGLGDDQVDQAVAGIDRATSLNMKPVLRILGEAWDKSPAPTADEMADFIVKVKEQSNLKYVQVWNEPHVLYDGGSENFYDSGSLYAQYVIDVKNSLKSKLSAAGYSEDAVKIVSAHISGGSEVDFGGGVRKDGYQYSQETYDTSGFLDAIDYFAYHAYSDISYGSPITEEVGTCVEGDEVLIEEYKPKVCAEGILGYRYHLNEIMKRTGTVPKVFLTEFGYRDINRRREQGSADYSTARDYLVEAIGLIQNDPYVEGAQIFLLNGLDEFWYGDSWIDVELEPLPHLVEVSDLACGGFDTYSGESSIPDRTSESYCDENDFAFHPDIEGMNVTDAEYGDNECIWQSVTKILSCNEIQEQGLSEGKLYVRVYNEQGSPITSEVTVNFNSRPQVTSVLEDYPVCNDVLDKYDTQGDGFAVFEFEEYEIQELLMHNPDSSDYNYDSDVLSFSIADYPNTDCDGDGAELPQSLYVRFGIVCSS